MIKKLFSLTKKGFTLSEVLIVILIISVVASIAYPMYTRAMTKSRAVEGINLLTMVRNKQLQRFAKEGQYFASFEGIGQITADQANEVPSGNILKVKKYTLTLDNDNGCVSALYKSGGTVFTLSISYNNSGLGCTGDICSTFANIVANAEDICKTEPSVPVTPPSPPVPPNEEPSTDPVIPSPLNCTAPQPSDTEVCSNCGVKTRVVTCDKTTGQWHVSDFGQCIGNKTDTAACEAGYKGHKIRNCTNNVWGEWNSSGCTKCSAGGCCSGPKPADKEYCANCGEKTRSVTCDTATGKWQVSEFGECTGSKTETSACEEGYSGQKVRKCTNNVWGEWNSSACTKCSTGHCCPGVKPEETEYCANCGAKIRTVTCNSKTNKWDIGEWSECTTTILAAGCPDMCSGPRCSYAPSNGCERRETVACASGYKYRRCINNVWQTEWDMSVCLNCPKESKPSESELCSNCGSKTRTVTCNPQTNKWEAGEWSGSCETNSNCLDTCSGSACSMAPSGSCVRLENVLCESGSKTRKCVNNVWRDWDMINCLNCPRNSKPSESELCSNCGAKSRTVTCNSKTNKWDIGEWSECKTTILAPGCPDICSGSRCSYAPSNVCERREKVKCAVRGHKYRNCVNNVWETQWRPDSDCCE